eukprot:26396_4
MKQRQVFCHSGSFAASSNFLISIFSALQLRGPCTFKSWRTLFFSAFANDVPGYAATPIALQNASVWPFLIVTKSP